VSFGTWALIMFLAALGRLLWRGLRFAPPQCLKGSLMYTRAKSLPNLYIRNIIPGDMGIPLLGYRAMSGRGYAVFLD
jgi:hypothetical protein